LIFFFWSGKSQSSYFEGSLFDLTISFFFVLFSFGREDGQLLEKIVDIHFYLSFVLYIIPSPLSIHIFFLRFQKLPTFPSCAFSPFGRGGKCILSGSVGL